MKIIAVETSTDICSVCVIANEKTSQCEINLKQIHSEKIISLIDQCLKNLNMDLDEINAIGVSIGPGSFTGLRIGLSTVKGICFVKEKPIIAVPTLDALALKAAKFYEIFSNFCLKEVNICPIIDAKQGDFYYGFYSIFDAKVVKLSEFKVGTFNEILNQITKPTIFIGDGVNEIKEGQIFERAILLKGKLNQPEAYYVALIAVEKLQRGEFSDLNSLEPLYIKDFKIKMG
jgi:tRNA threonylcarbamoyladenosine biosynthesis protein TsaB